MKFKTYSFLFLVPAVLMLVASCQQSSSTDVPEDMPTIGTPDNFDYGKVENGIYKNNYFQCSMKVPAGWSVQNEEETELLQEHGKEQMRQNGIKNVDAAMINTATLLTVFHHPMDSIQLGPNPSIVVVAENTSARKDIKDGQDYLEVAKGMLAQTGQPYEIDNEIPIKENINGSEFYLMKTSVNTGDITVYQHYRATVIKGFSFVIICTFFTKEEEKVLSASMNSLKFEK